MLEMCDVFEYICHRPLRGTLEDVTMHMEPFYWAIGLLLLLKSSKRLLVTQFLQHFFSKYSHLRLF